VEKLTGTPPRTFDAFAKDFARVLEGKATAKS
jgi:hypothetical protein